jgi:hypothetical protein
VKEIIHHGMKTWLETTQTHFEVHKYDMNIKKALGHQQQLGWNHFIRGRISLE